MKKILIILLCGLFLVACSENSDNDLITYTEAKEMMINDSAILLDVRTEEEYKKDHIEGATLLTLETINSATISNITTNKEEILIVYCQSGKRSSQAKAELEKIGYKKVYDLGAMNNWKE